MRKRVFGRKLKRTTNQRKGLFKSLVQALVLHGRIKTTEAKAKSIKGEVEKLITHAKKNPTDAMQTLQKHVPTKTAQMIIDNVAPVFKDRPGGYTRIVKIGSRKKDNAPMVILEFVEQITVTLSSNKRVKDVTKKAKPAVKKTVVKAKENAKPNKTNKK